MTKLTTVLLTAAALAAAATTSAFAQAGPGATPWMMESNSAYVFDSPGKMMVMSTANMAHAKMMKGAHRVPNNTMFFMVGDQLYMRTGHYPDNNGPRTSG